MPARAFPRRSSQLRRRTIPGRRRTRSLSSPVDLLNEGTLVAQLLDAELTIELGLAPRMDWSLDVIAGDSATSFYADSALAGFPTIPASEAAGQVLFSGYVWDYSNPSDGVCMMGLGPSMGSFQAWYNGAAPDGLLFREGLGVIWISAGQGEGGMSEPYPSSGYAPIHTAVYDMSIHAAFALTADDRALMSTNYGLVPEPTGLVLLVVGGALAARWRRT
jgi:hypothetical protein